MSGDGVNGLWAVYRARNTAQAKRFQDAPQTIGEGRVLSDVKLAAIGPFSFQALRFSRQCCGTADKLTLTFTQMINATKIDANVLE